MDFALTEEQEAIITTARDFATQSISPHVYEWEKAGTIPRSMLLEAGSLGLGGLCVSSDVGGSGLTRLDAVLVFEALALSCPSVAAFISIHNMCACMAAFLQKRAPNFEGT